MKNPSHEAAIPKSHEVAQQKPPAANYADSLCGFRQVRAVQFSAC